MIFASPVEAMSVAMIGAGTIGCALFIIVTTVYKFTRGDKCGSTREVRNEGLILFGIVLVLGVIIYAISLI